MCLFNRSGNILISTYLYLEIFTYQPDLSVALNRFLRVYPLDININMTPWLFKYIYT